jgi:hypothetical protein
MDEAEGSRQSAGQTLAGLQELIKNDEIKPLFRLDSV